MVVGSIHAPEELGIGMAWEQTALAVAAIVTAVLTAIKLYCEIRKDRRTTVQMLDHVKSLRRMVEQNQKDLNLLQDAFDKGLTTQSQSAIKERQQALKEGEAQRKKEEFEWKKLTQIAKAIGWILDRPEDEG